MVETCTLKADADGKTADIDATASTVSAQEAIFSEFELAGGCAARNCATGLAVRSGPSPSMVLMKSAPPL
ncbi:hypothetical protein D3C87_1996160 [compost metagenome]